MYVDSFSFFCKGSSSVSFVNHLFGFEYVHCSQVLHFQMIHLEVFHMVGLEVVLGCWQGLGRLAWRWWGWLAGRWLGWLLYLIFLYDYCTEMVSAIKTWTLVTLEVQCITCIFIDTLFEYDYGLPTIVLKDG